MDNIQRAIEFLKKLKNYSIDRSDAENYETAISAMQELQQHKEGMERLKYALKDVDISELNIEYDDLSNALELMQQTNPIYTAQEKEMTLNKQ